MEEGEGGGEHAQTGSCGTERIWAADKIWDKMDFFFLSFSFAARHGDIQDFLRGSV